MSGGRQRLVWVFGAVLLCGLGDRVEPMTKQQAESLIAREAPVGTSRAEVVAFLERSKIEHSSLPPGRDNAPILAIIRNVAGGNFLVSRALQIHFEFRADRLVGQTFKEVSTGP